MNIPFRPKLIEVFARGYSLKELRCDLIAGLIVGLMAILLAIGFGIASIPAGIQTPISPAAIGLTTAIIAGFIISALGGSRVQIGGPTGAFIPIVAGIAITHGMSCLWMATLIAGLLLVVLGFLKAGAFSRYIPLPVVVGFTSGIAVIIAIQQFKPMLGLTISGAMPPDTMEKLKVLALHLNTIDPATAIVSITCFALLLVIPAKWIPRALVLILATVVVNLIGLTQTPLREGLSTIGSTFGRPFNGSFIDAIPAGLPSLVHWDFSWSLVREAIPSAMIIAFLAGLESILSAMSTDKMIKDRHDSDQELIALGIANCVVPWFGGIPATGAIARTSTNVQSGGRSPVSGMLHALFLLGVMLVASRWVAYVPMCVLAAILLHVAVKMFEAHHFNALRKVTRGELLIAATTFLLTVLVDLNVGVGFGLGVAAITLILRLREITVLRPVRLGDEMAAERRRQSGPQQPEILLFRVEGILFYAVADEFIDQLEQAIKDRPLTRVVILRIGRMLALDFQGLLILVEARRFLRSKGISLVLCNTQPHPTHMMLKHGFLEELGLENLCGDLDHSMQRAQEIIAQPADELFARKSARH